MNVETISAVNAALVAKQGDGLISFSHFLPRIETLPDWVDLGTTTFRSAWLEHPAGATAVKFSRVAGSSQIDEQLRALTSGVPRDVSGVPRGAHVHAFGHSHRPKDFALHGVRYASQPLGFPKERRERLTHSPPELKLLWNVDGPPPARDKPLLRYWEENGGREPALDAMIRPGDGGGGWSPLNFLGGLLENAGVGAVCTCTRDRRKRPDAPDRLSSFGVGPAPGPAPA